MFKGRFSSLADSVRIGTSYGSPTTTGFVHALMLAGIFLTRERIVPSALLAHFPYVQGEV